jgi:hypothetical protein
MVERIGPLGRICLSNTHFLPGAKEVYETIGQTDETSRVGLGYG